MYNYVFECLWSVLWGIYLGVELLSYMVIPCFVLFWGINIDGLASGLLLGPLEGLC